MNERLNTIAAAVKAGYDRLTAGAAGHRRTLFALGLAGVGTWALVAHPPLQTVARGEVAVRTNQLTGGAAEFDGGSVLVLPGLHALRRLPLRDQVYRPAGAAPAAYQSVEGLSFGIDLSVRYALDPARVVAVAKTLPEDINGQIVEPAVQGVIYKVLTRYTVREIFSSKRAEIQQNIESELRTYP